MDIYEFIAGNVKNDNIFFEIGSHFGIDTRRIFNLTEARIHCFEPDHRNIKIMEKNGIFEIVEKVNQVAISDFKGQSKFYLSSGNAPEVFSNPDLNDNQWSASNSLKKPKSHLEKVQWCKFEDEIEVECITIDGYCSENNIEKIDFIWMDVQGAEDLVLTGISKMRDKIRFIYTEYNDEDLYENSANKEKIINILGSNWSIVYDFGSDILLENTKFNNI